MTDEVLGVVTGASVHTTVIVGLSLQVDHFVGGLEADLKLFTLELVHLPASLLEGLQIVGALTGLLVNELTVVVVTKVLALHSHSVTDQRSKRYHIFVSYQN